LFSYKPGGWRKNDALKRCYRTASSTEMIIIDKHVRTGETGRETPLLRANFSPPINEYKSINNKAFPYLEPVTDINN